jgi:hypothetical protein
MRIIGEPKRFGILVKPAKGAKKNGVLPQMFHAKIAKCAKTSRMRSLLSMRPGQNCPAGILFSGGKAW